MPRIAFLSTSPIAYDVESPERRPLGGTESAIAYLARNLAARGHAVSLIRFGPEGSLVAGIRHRDLRQVTPSDFQDIDIVVVVAAASDIAKLHGRLIPASLPILYWTHHASDRMPVADLASPDILSRLAGIVFISRWQEEDYLAHFKLGETRRFIVGNGLTPAFENLFNNASELLAAKAGHACCYTSTPFRGLDALIAVAHSIEQPARFDIYSSMRVYDGDDRHFTQLYDAIRATPNMAWHGSIPQNQLAARLRAIDFMSYPCTFPETYCIATLEALAAGMEVISTRLGALPETTLGLATLIEPPTDGHEEEFVRAYSATLDAALRHRAEDPRAWAEARYAQTRQVMATSTWSLRAQEWERVFTSVLAA
jgi:glycosyltransferase involved in cell wall biosynthesis